MNGDRDLRPSRRPVSQVARVFGWVWACSAPLMFAPALVDIVTGGDDALGFVAAAVAVGVAGIGLIVAFRAPQRTPSSRLFASVGAGAVALVIAAAVPYLTTGALGRIDDALFESVAGVTTTAMTVVERPEALGQAVLLWRALTQWLGGFGLVLLAVAVLPFLGSGETERSRAEPHGVRQERFLARVVSTVRPLSLLYGGGTAVVAGAYGLAGLGAFDAVAHALTTVSTGGYATRAGSFGALDAPAAEWVAIAVMLAAGTSATLWIRAVRDRRVALLASAELRWYVGLIVGGAAVVALTADGGGLHDTIRHSLFLTSSFTSTTGFVVGDPGALADGAQAVLLILVGIGSMSASAGGGFRVARVLTLVSFVRAEIIGQLHPRAVTTVRLGRTTVDDRIVQRTLGFQAVFSVFAATAALAVAASGESVLTSVWAAASAISSAGPVLGLDAAGQVGSLDAAARAMLAVVMVAGRIEIYPIIVGVGTIADWAALGRRRRALATRVGVGVGHR